MYDSDNGVPPTISKWVGVRTHCGLRTGIVFVEGNSCHPAGSSELSFSEAAVRFNEAKIGREEA